MKKHLLLFVIIVACSASAFSQQDTDKITENFAFNWNDYLLPDCPFLIYHGKDESYFIDSRKNRVPNHSYLDIKTGGKDHFIVQDEEGFHILNAKLERVTEKAYTGIQLNNRTQLELANGAAITYYLWDELTKKYSFKSTLLSTSGWEHTGLTSPVYPKLGNINDSRFKAKRIERLRLGIDMSETLTVGQKGKNVLIKKGETLVYKGPTKPMLFYNFAITGSKGPHSIYHPISKDPILENCDRFWCVGSFLVVSVKESLRKHIISNTGEIILSSAGEIRYYNYEFGGHKYAFFCDGRSVVNMSGDLIYKSDGELIGVGEHYIYSGYSGGYLGDLTKTIKMDCSYFDRYHNLTVGKTDRNAYRLYNSKSVLVNNFHNYFIDKSDSLVVCVTDTKTVVCNPFKQNVANILPIQVNGRQISSSQWKYHITSVDQNETKLEGRFDPKDGVIARANYLKIEWPESEAYHIVITKDGLVRYLDADGQELFD